MVVENAVRERQPLATYRKARQRAVDLNKSHLDLNKQFHNQGDTTRLFPSSVVEEAPVDGANDVEELDEVQEVDLPWTEAALYWSQQFIRQRYELLGVSPVIPETGQQERS